MNPTDTAAIAASITATVYNTSSIMAANDVIMLGAGDMRLSGKNPQIVTDQHSIDVNDLAQTLEIVKERLFIITPCFEKHELYPALKQAYDNYRTIEAMLRGTDGSR